MLRWACQICRDGKGMGRVWVGNNWSVECVCVCVCERAYVVGLDIGWVNQ